MTKETKITLSPKELELVCNRDWILTKHIIIDKVYKIFGELSVSMQERVRQITSTLPREAAEGNPKISRGENYQGLPYVMLDYPRCFGKQEVLAVRTLFWWGNYFSSTLHVKGPVAKNMVINVGKKSIISGIATVRISDRGDEWNHTLHSENYMSSQEWLLKEATQEGENSFLKLAMQYPLKDWDMAPVFLKQNFEQWMNLIKK